MIADLPPAPPAHIQHAAIPVDEWEPTWTGKRVGRLRVKPLVDAVARHIVRREGMRLTTRPRLVSVELWPFRGEYGRRALDARAAIHTDNGRMSVSYETAYHAHELVRAARGARIAIRPYAAHAVIHEVLHLVNPRAPEAVVDAVAADMTPRFLRAYLGRSVRVNPANLVGYDAAWDVWFTSARIAGTRSPWAPAAQDVRMRWLLTGRASR